MIDAALAYECGADALGFVMGGRVLPIEVEPLAQLVRPLIKRLPKTVKTFLVTHLLEADEILALAEYVGVSGIQISESLSTEKLKAIRLNFGGELIKTVPVINEQSIEELKRVEPFCDYLLLDSCSGGYIGGTGETSDWSLCRRLVEVCERPTFLAGGLTPENVKDGLLQTKASGADVSTGVSSFSDDYLRKDRKDLQKMKSFIRSAREFEI